MNFINNLEFGQAVSILFMVFIISYLWYCIVNSRRGHYTVSIFDKNTNSNLRNVSELSVLDALKFYYNKPFCYIEIVDKKTKDMIVVKQSEQNRFDYEVKNLLKKQIRLGSRIKVRSVSDKNFLIQIHHREKYWDK